MAMEFDIREAIRVNLSAEVGTRLSEVLAKGEADAKSVLNLTDKVTKLEARNAELTVKCAHADAIIVSEKKLAEREAALALKEAVMAERDKHVNMRIDDHQKMFATVFAGPASRLAFNLMGSWPVPNGQFGQQSQPFSASADITAKPNG